MADRPATLPTWATNPDTTVAPSSGQQAAGFAVGSRPPARWFNWLFHWLSAWAAYVSDGVFTGKADGEPGVNGIGAAGATGANGVVGEGTGNKAGVRGAGSLSGSEGVRGEGTGGKPGVLGYSDGTGEAVKGLATAGGTGVLGDDQSLSGGIGTSGYSYKGTGILAQSGAASNRPLRIVPAQSTVHNYGADDAGVIVVAANKSLGYWDGSTMHWLVGSAPPP